MNSTRSFQEKSYQQHSEHFKDYGLGGSKEEHAKTWFEKGSVGMWRHLRMYRLLDPILNADKTAKWLTVGDGRYGMDAKYILEKDCDVIASDISDTLLKEAKDMGYIDEYRKENAESLTFKDSQFDYVLCKEAYHHFPRPMLALYEMLRVAHKGVLLIEPSDDCIHSKLSYAIFKNVKNAIRSLLGSHSSKHSYEDSGNYVYSISRREIEKVALGLNCKVVSFKGINDAYIQGVEYEKMSEKGPLQKKIKALIYLRNLLCWLGLRDYVYLTAIIFKQEPSKDLLGQLRAAGYEVVCLPDNPYISG